MVQEKMQVGVTAVHSQAKAAPHLAMARYLVVLISMGLLQDSAFIDVLCMFERGHQADPVEIVTVLAGSNFTFPGPEFYADIEEERAGGALVAKGFRRVFNILALPFSPHGSSLIMNAQVDEICRRFRQCQVGARGRRQPPRVAPRTIADTTGAQSARL